MKVNLRQRLVLLFFALWLLFSAAAQAPAPALTPMSPELKAFVLRPEQQKAINEASAKAWFQQLPDCKEPKLKQRNVLVDQVPAFDIAGNPYSGQWRVVTWIDGCGEERIIDLMYWFPPNGTLTTTLLLPGTTLADPRLQKDAVFYAMMGMAGITPKDCKEHPVINTKFKNWDSGALPNAIGAIKQPWTEEWTVRLCGVTGVVPMHFVPDAHGTTIHSEVLKAPK